MIVIKKIDIFLLFIVSILIFLNLHKRLWLVDNAEIIESNSIESCSKQQEDFEEINKLKCNEFKNKLKLVREMTVVMMF
jgi:biopolymer transport protein ExbB/TolQ